MSVRKIGTVAAAAACTLALIAGCGTTTSADKGSSGAPQQQPKCGGPNGKYKIGVSQANVAEPYRERMDEDIKKYAKKLLPQVTDVDVQDGQQNNAKQRDDVNNFITKKVDLLIISPNEAAPLTQAVKDAYNKGIPVIVLDRKINGDQYTSFIGGDNKDIGKQAGQFVASKLLPGGGKVGEIRGLDGSTPAKERSDGFKEGIQGKKIDVVESQSGEWVRDKAQQKAEAMFKAHPDIQVMFAQGDPMAEGAYLAAQSAGLKNVKFVGIDGLPIPSGGIKAVEAGRLAATFVYPTGGKEAIEAAKKILVDCKPVPKNQTLPTQQVTKDNAAQVYTKLNQG
ncbi:substrate-binding domain-containing protein [Sciscionella sediminilitoris]|uniref:substrate-binding domain-containing protein n=1 Tax=Sciscionella sediminilitoris TaxID=1445613 RepID=UPI0004DF3236|nr:substrate-binding domain-containing protein [Sciscionella sp. SE31]